MAWKTMEVEVEGVVPLLMHNGLMADKQNEFALELARFTKKRTKTDADYIEMENIEMKGGLYMDNGRPCIPGEMIEAMLLGGAKKFKQGPNAKLGLVVDGNFPLEYNGPKTIEGLLSNPAFRDRRLVKMSGGKVIRTRPRFDKWSLKFTIQYNPDVLNERDVKQIVEKGGEVCALGDYRPKFGRFRVVKADTV